MVAELLVVTVMHNVIWHHPGLTTTAIFNLSVNFALLCLMCKTTRHNLRYRSPLIIDYPDEEIKPAFFLDDDITFKV